MDRRLVAYVVPKHVAPSSAGKTSQSSEEWFQSFSELPLDGVIRDPAARLEFLLKQRRVLHDKPDATQLALAKPEWTERSEREFTQRRSHRSFLTTPLPLQAFSEFLACLREVSLDGSFLPRYRYPSAGGLYPVRTYLHVAPDRVEGIEAATYFYDPHYHSLKLLSSGARIDRTVHTPPNRPIFDGSAFSLLLVGDMAAIEPMYGPMARDFCVLEAGYMGQLLMTSAAQSGIGLCPIGGVDFGGIREALALEEGHIYLHCLLGGPNIPEVSAASVSKKTVPNGSELIADLRRFLSDRLPDFMVPSAFVSLDALPVTDTGKLNRAALPLPAESCNGSKGTPVVPQTEIERVLAGTLAELLETGSLGIHDNFFDLGANSMHMVRFSARLKEVLQRDVSVVSMFKHPTIQLLAAHLSEEDDPQSDFLIDINRQAQRQVEAARRQRQRAKRRSDG